MSYLALARSLCVYCGRGIETDVEPPADPADPADPAALAVVWTTGQPTLNRECDAAPNPDEGPMPDHRPGVIARRSEQPPPPPSAPYPTLAMPYIPRRRQNEPGA